MRSPASDRFLIGAFIVLVLSSVGVKAWIGPPSDGLIETHPGQVEQQLVRTLQSQGFSTKVQAFKIQSSIVFAVRSECRLSVRDARYGEADMTVFARDARSIGSLRYLYDGRSYSSPPTFAMRMGRLEAELLNRLRLSTSARVPVALAKSPACGANEFGLDDLKIVS
jgi:hypothetical protein